jgi:hypothetical protein
MCGTNRKGIPDEQPTTREAVEMQRVSNANRIKRKWCHQTRMTKERAVKEKGRPDKQQAIGRAVKIQRCQGQTGSRESCIIREGHKRQK